MTTIYIDKRFALLDVWLHNGHVEGFFMTGIKGEGMGSPTEHMVDCHRWDLSDMGSFEEINR